MDVRDQYGNAVGMLDEYGNPVPVEAYAHPTGYGGQNQPKGTDSGEGLRKSGSSSSSSSEDDGMGGRRKKKGLKEKIKEKLPGGHKKDADPEGAAPHVEELHEKKGLMEKIKEKLPGGHH